MTHYINGITVNMYCDHPELENNSAASIGCNADCQHCKFGKAELSIDDCMKLLKAMQSQTAEKAI